MNARSAADAQRMRSGCARGSGGFSVPPRLGVFRDRVSLLFLKSGFGLFRLASSSAVALASGAKLGLLSARQLKSECNKTYAII